MLGLPEEFLNCSDGPGGGVIQGTASEATLICLLAAKEKFVRQYMAENSKLTEAEIKGKLVAYSSNQSNSSIEKAGLIGSMTMRLLPSDSQGRLTAETLLSAIQKDREQGLIPCYVIATLGTTGTCAFDDLQELGPVCQKENLWLHVDAAYAGTAFCCPEYRYLMKGIEMADSFNFNPHKWMLVNFDCSALWVKNAKYLVETFSVERIYLDHQHQGLAPEYRHWQIPLGRRFRALKLWFVLRIYGVEGIQNHVRKQIGLSKYFEEQIKNDRKFEVCTSAMGLVCFRMIAGNKQTQLLLDKITARKNLFMVPCYIGEKLVIRFVVCSRLTEKKDIDYALQEIQAQANEVLEETEIIRSDIFNAIEKSKISTIEIRTKNDNQLLEKTK